MISLSSDTLEHLTLCYDSNISIGDIVYKKSKTCAIKELLIDNRHFSFFIPSILNGAKRRGNICTMFLLIDYSSHIYLNSFTSVVSSRLDIPNLSPSTFVSDIDPNLYVLSIRVPINAYGYKWTGVSVNCDIGLFQDKVVKWPDYYNSYTELTIEGIHFSDMSDRNTNAHINFILKSVNPLSSDNLNTTSHSFYQQALKSMNPIHTYDTIHSGDVSNNSFLVSEKTSHIFTNHLYESSNSEYFHNNPSTETEQELHNLRDLLTDADSKIRKLESKNIELKTLYKENKRTVLDNNDKLRELELEISDYIETVEKLTLEKLKLDNEMSETTQINAEFQKSIEELNESLNLGSQKISDLKYIVDNISSKNKVLVKELDDKDSIVSYTRSWLENIVPYYKSIDDRNGVIRYKGFTLHTATSENLNHLSSEEIKDIILSGAWFQALPFKRMYVRTLIEVIKSHDRNHNIGLRETLTEHKELVKKLLNKYYNTKNIEVIKNYTTGNGW